VGDLHLPVTLSLVCVDERVVADRHGRQRERSHLDVKDIIRLEIKMEAQELSAGSLAPTISDRPSQSKGFRVHWWPDIPSEAISEDFEEPASIVAGARAFAEHIEPDPKVRYDWVYDYALRAWDETEKAADKVDEKASKFVGFGMTGTAVVIAVLTNAASKGDLSFTAAMLPSLIAITIAISFALRAFSPTSQVELPSIQRAYEIAQWFKAREGETEDQARERALAVLAARLHQSRTDQKEVVMRKSGLLTRAYTLAVAALVLTSLPLFVTVLRAIVLYVLRA